MFGLGVDIGHQPVFHLIGLAEGLVKALVVFPGLLGGSTMTPCVGGEHAEGEPPAVEFLGSAVDKSADVVAPEGKSGEPQGKASPEGGRHGRIGIGGIASPVKGIALATRPGGTRPDNVLPAHLARDISHHLVVTQGIEVMLVKSGAPRGIHPVPGRRLPEVHLDGSYPQLQQAGNLLPVPLHSGRIREIKHRILKGKPSLGIAHIQPLLNDLGEKGVLRYEIGKLPQAGAEAHLFEVGDHLSCILEPG